MNTIKDKLSQGATARRERGQIDVLRELLIYSIIVTVDI